MSDVLEIANFPCTELVCDIGSGAQVLYLGVVMTSVEGSSFLLSCTCSLCLGLDVVCVFSPKHSERRWNLDSMHHLLVFVFIALPKIHF